MAIYGNGGGAAAGAQSAAQGIGAGLNALAMAPMVAQQSEQNAALTLAKIFANQQSGNKHASETDLLKQKLTDILAVQADPTRATSTAQSYSAVSGDAPYVSVGNTGRSLNRLDGTQNEAGTLANTYDREVMSRVNENNAQAGAARALMQQRLGEQGIYQEGGPKGSAPIKLSENQGNALIYGSRARAASKIISDLQGSYSPAMINTKRYIDDIPLVGGALGAGVNTFGMSDSDQMAEQAQRDMINAFLRRESGASISQKEFDNANKQYIPQPGDSEQVLAQKSANRELAIDGLRVIAGPGGKKVDELSDKAIESGKTANVDRKSILAQAREAVARGADRKAVISELRSKYGIESAGF